MPYIFPEDGEWLLLSECQVVLGSSIANRVEIDTSPEASRCVCKLPPKLANMSEYHRSVVRGFVDKVMEHLNEDLVREFEHSRFRIE